MFTTDVFQKEFSSIYDKNLLNCRLISGLIKYLNQSEVVAGSSGWRQIPELET